MVIAPRAAHVRSGSPIRAIVIAVRKRLSPAVLFPSVSIKLDITLLRSLEQDPLLADRLRRLSTIPGTGPITALTWALEVGDTSRFRSIKQAISYCGLCSAEKSSADKVMRTPISKQRNKHIH